MSIHSGLLVLLGNHRSRAGPGGAGPCGNGPGGVRLPDGRGARSARPAALTKRDADAHTWATAVLGGSVVRDRTGSVSGGLLALLFLVLMLKPSDHLLSRGNGRPSEITYRCPDCEWTYSTPTLPSARVFCQRCGAVMLRADEVEPPPPPPAAPPPPPAPSSESGE